MGNHPNRTAASPTKCSSDAQGWLPSSLAGRATSANLRAQSACCRGTVAAVRSFRESSTSLDVLPRRLDNTKASKILGSVTGGAGVGGGDGGLGGAARRVLGLLTMDTDLQEALSAIRFLGFGQWE